MSMEGEKRGTHLRGKCSTVDKEISGYQWGWEKRPNGNRRKERRPMVRVSKPRQSFTSRFITPSSSSPHHAHVLISIHVVSLQYPAFHPTSIVYHRDWWFVQLTGSYCLGAVFIRTISTLTLVFNLGVPLHFFLYCEHPQTCLPQK